MDIEILLHSIMTDAKGSKSNIAAKFQNALNLHFLPPIGVFWDIENCQVPKGKSAIALVQNIREKFFPHHREAEFMCVCDINKESKTVIQELILAQVTVVHISATSKNAADDKLKQCMRRFVDTHGAPSTLLLISDDVNFASDLSDFRHRHNIRIILLHRGHAHQSLLACAHEHYEFCIVSVDLPSRSPIKSSDNRPNEFVVKDLPTNKNIGLIKSQLKKLSQNCGGKVVHIKGNTALMRFANAEAAERAQKRMDKAIVCGNEISVSFYTRTDPEFSDSPPRGQTKDCNSSNEVSGSSSSSRDSSLSPLRETEQKSKRNENNLIASKKFNFPPPPLLDSQNFPSLLHCPDSSNYQKSKNLCTSASESNIEMSKENKLFQLDWNKGRSLSETNKCQEVSAFSPFKKDQDLNTRAKYCQRNVGRVSPFVMQDCDKAGRTIPIIPLSDSGCIRRNQCRSESYSNSFPLYSNNYSGLAQNVGIVFGDLQRVSDPVLYSSQFNGNSLQTEIHSGSRTNPVSPLDNSSAFELIVSNLDPSFEVNEMKKHLLSAFREHVMVLHISMTLQPDGNAKATLKVPSFQDAQYAISQLHRKKIGHKRILISYAYSDRNPPIHVLRSEVAALLNDIPTKSLPLIKFRELYEKRYHRPVAVSELNRIRDVVTVQGDSGSRIVYLNQEYHRTPSLPDSVGSQELSIEKPYCVRHFHVSTSQGWADRYSTCPLPLVHITLKTLATAVHTLLDSHQGSLPLISFCDCYEEEIGPLPVVGHFVNVVCKDHASDLNLEEKVESSVKGHKGVPLEHLIACITGVEVAKCVICIKKVQWLENKTDIQATQNFSPALLGQLTTFGREVMDLLKSQPQCLIPFNKFIPTYHHHFGKQCRVADYGFTKLIDLLEAIPHIVQVLGEGQNRQVTLTHRTQVKRFAGELLRILKSRASKQISVSEFSQAYEQVIEKPFEITNYGVCEIEDMLDEVPENVIVTCNSGNETIIGIPKREQTTEEIELTKQFADEVIELMKHTPYCSMAFNKFIPAYHHHFGKQCRVADYGFTKLIELFEAIPYILDVKGTGEDKILNLVESQQHKILTERLLLVLKAQPQEVIDVNQLNTAYAQLHGHTLRPVDFGFSDLNELLEKLNSSFKIVTGYGVTHMTNNEQGFIDLISLNVRCLLMEQCDGKMDVQDLNKEYQKRFDQSIHVSSFLKDIKDIVVVEDMFIHLTPLHMLARNMIILLKETACQIPFSTFGSLYQQRFGTSITPANYGFPNLNTLLEQLSDYFTVKGKKQKRIITLHAEIAGLTFPNLNVNNTPGSLDQMENSPGIVSNINPKRIISGTAAHERKTADILSQPVPSCVPSPNLQPLIKERVGDLMGFDTPPIRGADSHFELSAEPSSSHGEITFTTQHPIATASEIVSLSVQNFHSEYPHSMPHQQAIPVTSTTSLSASPLLPHVSLNSYLFSNAQVLPNMCKEATIRSQLAVTFHSVIKDAESHSHSVNELCKSRHGINDTRLPSAVTAEGKPRINAKFAFDLNSVKRSKMDSCSVDDLTNCSHQFPESKDSDLPSTKSTPTRASRQYNRRSRIAAQFSLPIND